MSGYRWELYVGDKHELQYVTTGVQRREKEVSYLVMGHTIKTSKINVKYKFSKIPRHTNNRYLYIYEFEEVLSFEDLIKCIGFEYIEGRTTLDGEFIPRSSICKTLRELMKNHPKTRGHALINCDLIAETQR